MITKCFDSILVRLKVLYPKTDANMYERFDSILVRLKGYEKTVEASFSEKVSIPYWFD